MFWRIVLYSVMAIALYHIVSKYVFNTDPNSCGCNIEDDDIRRDALMARMENKKKEKGAMKAELQDFLQENMEERGIGL